MTIPTRKPVPFFSALAAVVFVAGCGGDMSNTGNTTMRLSQLGLVMEAPAGWKVDGDHPGMCTKGDCTGLLMSEPLDGRSFKEVVDKMSSEFGAKVSSRRETTVAEKPAVKVVMDDPGGMKVFRVYLDCGSAIAYVSFALPKGEFSSSEASLEKSVSSLRRE